MKILYEDQDVIVCYKEAGLATQSGKTFEKDLVSILKKHLAEEEKENSPAKKPGGNREIYLGIVHRLDQPVEGVLVFAKNKNAAQKLSDQLTGGGLNKKYYAVVYGTPKKKQDKLINNMKKEGNLAVIVEQGETSENKSNEESKKAVLSYEVVGVEEEITGRKLKGLPGCTLLRVDIETGRFHQIRAQLSHAGFPIVGDAKYGTEESMAYSREKHISFVKLCAYEVEFVHPKTGKQMIFAIE